MLSIRPTVVYQADTHKFFERRHDRVEIKDVPEIRNWRNSFCFIEERIHGGKAPDCRSATPGSAEHTVVSVEILAVGLRLSLEQLSVIRLVSRSPLSSVTLATSALLTRYDHLTSRWQQY
jgi:hypothetical protein